MPKKGTESLDKMRKWAASLQEEDQLDLRGTEELQVAAYVARKCQTSTDTAEALTKTIETLVRQLGN